MTGETHSMIDGVLELPTSVAGRKSPTLRKPSPDTLAYRAVHTQDGERRTARPIPSYGPTTVPREVRGQLRFTASMRNGDRLCCRVLWRHGPGPRVAHRASYARTSTCPLRCLYSPPPAAVPVNHDSVALMSVPADVSSAQYCTPARLAACAVEHS